MAVPSIWPNGGSRTDIFFRNESGNAEVFEANSGRMFTNDETFKVEACFTNLSGRTPLWASKNINSLESGSKPKKIENIKELEIFLCVYVISLELLFVAKLILC
jgi:hypothetical protein